MKWQVLKVLELVGRNSGTKRLLQLKEYNEERTTCVYTAPDTPDSMSENIDHNPDYLNKASRYFPLIGWIVEGFAFSVF
jgi:hypothetical protein